MNDQIYPEWVMKFDAGYFSTEQYIKGQVNSRGWKRSNQDITWLRIIKIM